MNNKGLKVIGGHSRGTFFPLRPGVYSIGREDSNTIPLPSPMVSRRHTEVRVTHDQVIVRDLSSANGTIINHRKVDEQQLMPGDKLFIGDFILEFVHESSVAKEISTGATSANLPLVNDVKPSFTILPSVDWRLKALCIIAALTLADHLLIAKLFTTRMQQDISAASIKRADAVVRFLAEKNKQDLANGNENLLDTDTVLEEEGVVAAFIANPSGRIVAPTYKLNQPLQNVTSSQALTLKSDTVVRSSRQKGGIYHFATPIRVFQEDKGLYEVVGVAMIVFSPKSVASASEAVKKIWLLAILFVPLMSLATFFMVRQITIPPITYLTEKVGLLFRGEVERIDRKTSIGALKQLIDAVNAAAVRFRDSDFKVNLSSIQPAENNRIIDPTPQTEWLVNVCSDAAMAINGSGMILAVNKRATSLLDIDELQPVGLHYEEVINNNNFKQFLKECVQTMKASSEKTLAKTLEYGDFAYQFSLNGWQGDSGQVQQYYIVIEKL